VGAQLNVFDSSASKKQLLSIGESIMCQRAKILSIISVVAAILFCFTPITGAKSSNSYAGESNFRYVMCAESIPGPGVGSEFVDCSQLTALGLAIDRDFQMGGDPGTEPINIGVGELRPIVIRKGVDIASVDLFKFALNGNSIGEVELFALQKRRGWPSLLTTLEVKLDRVFVKSMSFDEKRLMENVELVFTKIQLTFFERDRSGDLLGSQVFCWDVIDSVSNCSLEKR
jgi:type VI protein secretion system component Hcp